MTKMILFDTEMGKLKWVNTDGLDDYYRLLKCRTIDIPTRMVGATEYDIICDDEGLLKPEPVLSAVDSNFEPMLVGNLLFCHHDGEGNETDCTDVDMLNLQRHLKQGFTMQGPTTVVTVEYC